MRAAMLTCAHVHVPACADLNFFCCWYKVDGMACGVMVLGPGVVGFLSGFSQS